MVTGIELRTLISIGLMAACLVPGAVRADDLLTAPTLLAQDLDINEVRLGGAASNLELRTYSLPDPSTFSKARYDELEAEILFNPIELGQPGWLGEFRPELNGVLSTSGHESYVDAGVNWHVPLFDTPFYIETSLGVGVHNGYLNPKSDEVADGFHELGCRALVHYSYGVGANIGQNLTLTVDWQHMSGYVFGCTPNQGVNGLAAEVGWKF